MRAASRSGALVPTSMRCHLAVGAKQRDLQLPRTVAAAFQDAGKFARQMLEGGKHIAFKRDRVGEALLGDITRHRQARRDRLVFKAKRLIETAHKLDAEARGERGARLVQNIGDMLEADLRQRHDGLGREPQRRHRQRRQRPLSLIVRDKLEHLPLEGEVAGRSPAGGGRIRLQESSPPPGSLRSPTLPLQGEVKNCSFHREAK